MWRVTPSTSVTAAASLRTSPCGTRAVGLEDDLAAALAEAVGDGLLDLVERRRAGRSPLPSRTVGSAPGAVGLQQRQERRGRLLDAHPVPGRRDVHLLAAGHLHREEHERHELEDDVDHRRHVDVLVALLVGLASQEHG